MLEGLWKDRRANTKKNVGEATSGANILCKKEIANNVTKVSTLLEPETPLLGLDLKEAFGRK